jgi:tetratricopeptide (TPR) repeat protein
LFESKYDRQLLVAMIEVTTDSRFVERVESECRQLELVGGYLYAVAALAMQFRAGLSNHELVAAVGGDAANVLADLQRLLNRHLLIRDRDQLVRLRHRVIAERTVAFFQSTGQLSEPLIGLMYAMASAAAPGPLRGSRQGRLLIRLLNHELLIRLLRAPHSNTVDHAAVRHAYGELEAVLSNDYHYWLQRGSFETEEGDLDLAMNFIEQARAMNPDDAFVINAFAYVTLKRASRNAMDLGAIDAANEAFAILEGLVESRGHRDAYPFHIYGSQGISWVKRSPLPHGEKVKLMERLREVVKAGRELHPGRRDLKDLQRDLEREYLLLAVPGD